MIDAARNAYNSLLVSKKPLLNPQTVSSPSQQLASLPMQSVTVTKPKGSPYESPTNSNFQPSKHSVSWGKRDVVEKFMSSDFFVDLQDQLKFLDQKVVS